MASRLAHDAQYYLGKLYFDAVAYGSEELDSVNSVIARSDRYKTESSLETLGQVRGHRLLFGTDHPFFPPLEATEKWKSVVDNLNAIEGLQSWSKKEKEAVRGGNALTLFGLEV